MLKFLKRIWYRYKITVTIDGTKQFRKDFRTKEEAQAEAAKWQKYAERFTGDTYKAKKDSDPDSLTYYYCTKENGKYKTVTIVVDR